MPTVSPDYNRKYQCVLYVSTAVVVVTLFALSFSFPSESTFYYHNAVNEAYAQPYVETIKSRNLVIDLGNGVKTNAQLTYPVVGKGPFPGVLLVAGSGPVDMNETTGPNAQMFFQIAEYLSERGFAVLRYDKRGVGAAAGGFTVSDSNIWGNATFNDLKEDAEKALAVLAQQPEVDLNRITIIGHSEGTMIGPRVAIDSNNSNNTTATKVKNLVLMASVAQNLFDLVYFNKVKIPLLYAEKVLDYDHDGFISVAEAIKDPVFNTMVGNFTLLLETMNATKHQLNPNDNTNKDAYISINNDIKPKLEADLESASVVRPGEKCTNISACPIWLKSHFALEPTLSIIGNVSNSTGILILQNENDTQAPLQQAFILQQRLIDVNHPDHTLITFPNLGHTFYPSSEWQTASGPVPPYVLADLYSWLESHSGFTNHAAAAHVPTTSSVKP